jgi:WD40 repeat protein
LLRIPSLETVADLSRRHDYYDAVFSPDGQRLAIRDGNSIDVLNAMNGAFISTTEFDSPPRRFQFEPSANVLLVTREQAGIEMKSFVDSSTGAVLKTLDGRIDIISPDGKHALLAHDDRPGDASLIDLPGATNSRPLPIAPTTSIYLDAVFTPDSSILFLSDQCQAFDMKTGKLLWERNDLYDRALWTNGQFVYVYAYGSPPDGGWSILDVKTGKTLFSFLRHVSGGVDFIGVDFISGAHNSADFFEFYATGPEPNCAMTCWRLHRPYQWYGVACMPEFWMACAAAVGLVFSINRDRALKKRSFVAPATAVNAGQAGLAQIEA